MTRVPRSCAVAGCPKLTLGRLCPIHLQAAHQADVAHRGSANARGYTARWRRIRRQALLEEPLCRECAKQGRTTAAVDVHHITPKRAGGSDERTNLAPLCRSCHACATLREMRGGTG